jgi:hypothetical protein
MQRTAVPAAAMVRLTIPARDIPPCRMGVAVVDDVRGVWAACPTCVAVMRLCAVIRPPATLDVLASLRRSALGPPRWNAGSEA